MDWDRRIKAYKKSKTKAGRKEAKRLTKLPYETTEQLRKLSYKEFLQSKYWKLVRKKVLARDHNACVICKSTIKLHVHHDTYKHHYNELKHLEDLMTLCSVCHQEHHYAQN
jgi:5-methylcytosine-specific restriction endonuclease McrA